MNACIHLPVNVTAGVTDMRRGFNTLAALNRPGFTGEFFVQILCYFIKLVYVCIEGLLCFLWCDVSDGAVQAFCVVPIHPFQSFPFNLTRSFPRTKKVDKFGFDTVDRQGMQACPRGGPIVLSASALSYESPTLPTDGSMFASTNRSVYFMARYCEPRSEW